MSYSFSRRSDSCLWRTGSEGSRAASWWASCLWDEALVSREFNTVALEALEVYMDV